MIDYLKGSIVKFKLNLKKALENTANQCDDDKYQVKRWYVFRMRQFNHWR